MSITHHPEVRNVALVANQRDVWLGGAVGELRADQVHPVLNVFEACGVGQVVHQHHSLDPHPTPAGNAFVHTGGWEGIGERSERLRAYCTPTLCFGVVGWLLLGG